MSGRFIIEGGVPLSGLYPVQGNKNAALPLIAAAVAAQTAVELENVPRITDVERLLELIGALGVEAHWMGSGLRVDSSRLSGCDLPDEMVEALRGSVLLLGALAPRFERIRLAPPGGCPIGRRTFASHWRVFRAAGFEVTEDDDNRSIEIRRAAPRGRPEVYLPESSVTATENALILFALLGGGVIWNPAREPHVLALASFLSLLGCRFELDPLCFRIVEGLPPNPPSVRFRVPPDYIDAGTAAIAAAVTGGTVVLSGSGDTELRGFRSVLESFGLEFQGRADEITVSRPGRASPGHVTAGLWPSFPTDLVSLAIVLATQSPGNCLVHDWLYESRMFFVDKLARMGARVTLCDPHRVLVEGPSRLRGIRLESPDIRAGMALLVAGLCARGTTVVEHSEVVHRGYERVVHRLSALGARIEEKL